jgi:hypothetical protein
MASTLIPTKLLVTISEKLTSNGQELNYSNFIELSGIKPFDPRIMTIPSAAQVTVMNFNSSTVGAGTFVGNNVKYIRITNKDDTNFIRVGVVSAGDSTFYVKVEAGKSFTLGSIAEDANDSGAAFSGTYANATSITAQADTADVDIEYFVASV